MLIFGCLYSKAPSCHWSKVQGWSHHCWDQALIWRSANIIYKFLSQNVMNNVRIMSLSQWNSHAMFPERTLHIWTRLKIFTERLELLRAHGRSPKECACEGHFSPLSFVVWFPRFQNSEFWGLSQNKQQFWGNFNFFFFFKLEGSGTAYHEAVCGIIHKCGSLYVSKKRKKFDLWFFVNNSVKDARFAKL